jgi:TolB-like protein/Tfp pilus assembly protein PilF
MAIPARSRQLVRFGDFEADPCSGQLRRHGLKLKLADQSFRILSLLLQRPGEVVTREEFRRELWTEDTFVDFEAGLNSAIKRLRDALCDSADNPRFIETLPRHGYRFIASVERASPEPPPRIESLAVLPLENLIGDPAQDFFVDGMTDALVTRLAQIGALRVTSRTSAMRYKGTPKPLPEVARELKVDAIVEGTVTRSGDRVRITAQLVHGPTDQHLWAKHYERDLTDILLLQAEVAQAIADEIQVKLTPQEQARLASGRLVKPKAYEAYLRGRFHWDKRTEEGMRKGLELFQQALAADPSYALSHAGVAESYNMLGFWGVAAPHEVSPKTKSSARKALEIESSLAEAHAALGWALFAYDWDWAAGEREFRHAIDLNPGYTTAHQWYSHLLVYEGRVAEALAQVQRTLELDPLSLVMNSSGAVIYLLARQYDEAIEGSHTTLDLDPHFAPPYLWLGWALQKKGLHAEGLQALQQAVPLSGNGPRYLAGLGHGYAVAGRSSEALNMVAQLEQMAKQRYISAYDFAVIYAGLGEADKAFTWLEKAYEERSTWLALIKADSRFDAFHSDPRFQSLLKRLGLAA